MSLTKYTTNNRPLSTAELDANWAYFDNRTVITPIDTTDVRGGTVDAYSAIAAAINAANTGDIVYLPAGDYRIDTGITVTKSITIVGAPTFDRDGSEHSAYRGGTRILNYSSGNAFYFSVGTANKATHVTLVNLFIDGRASDDAKTVGHGIHIDGGDAATQYIVPVLENVMVWDAAEHGIYLTGWIWHPVFNNVHVDYSGKNGLRVLNTSPTYAVVHEGQFGIHIFNSGQQYVSGSTNTNAAGIYWNTPGGANSLNNLSCSNSKGRGVWLARGRFTGYNWSLESNEGDSAIRLGDTGVVCDMLVVDGIYIAHYAANNPHGLYCTANLCRNITIKGLFFSPSTGDATSNYDIVVETGVTNVSIFGYAPSSDGVIDVHGTPSIYDDTGAALIYSGNKQYNTGTATHRVASTSTSGTRAAVYEAYVPNSGGADPAGQYDFKALDSAGNETTYVSLDGRISDSTNGSEDGYLSLYVMKAGTLTEVARVSTVSAAGATALYVYDVDNNTLENVTVGAADSGGAGYKVLRIPN